jgi:dTDP-4-amino-4,6-dideoxygalactose transaminase
VLSSIKEFKKMDNPHKITEDFERAIAEYCGSPFAVSCTSCTSGILIALMWFKKNNNKIDTISMPKHSYVGVPASIKNAGFNVAFRDEEWSGEYQLGPLPLYDSARRTRRGMYMKGKVQVLSMHWSKILSVQQGGVILLDDPDAYEWMKKCRFDGRTAGVPVDDDEIIFPSVHSYLSPEVSAAALMRVSLLNDYNDDLPWDKYPDLSELGVFK